ncbi:hypothetical protein SteCoe_25237 [Stentor coeruleus]|uniref:Major facilitator superfamily (MFS) profile domain-containing protein n=1 Tax=Stentor coeruleus TaxID=5963 RepID=A0A1R2BFN6_9CILI|nr:hypothetical protein SteCoe_25237 [Stentor coeruleus]
MAHVIKTLKKDWATYGGSTIMTLILVYGAQGFRSFGSTARTLYFKNKFSLDPSELPLVSASITVAWYIKPLYGLISDSFPLFGYRRKSYIVILGLIGVISYATILISENLFLSILALILGELSQAGIDVICDGYMIEKARIDPEHGANDLQRISWSSLFLASIIGLLVGGNAADYVDPKYLLAMLAICPVLVLISAGILDEKREIKQENYSSLKELKSKVSILCKEVVKVKVLKILSFVILWQSSMLIFGDIFTYYLYDVIEISPSTVSYYSLTGYIGAFIGTVIASKHLINIPLVWKLALGRVLNSVILLFDIVILTSYYKVIGLSYLWFLFGPSALGSAIDSLLGRMPLLVIFADITPKHIEATFFALLASVYNVGSSISEIFISAIMNGTGITDSTMPNVWVLTVISIVVGILSLVILFILPNEENKKITTAQDDFENSAKILEEPLISKTHN